MTRTATGNSTLLPRYRAKGLDSPATPRSVSAHRNLPRHGSLWRRVGTSRSSAYATSFSPATASGDSRSAWSAAETVAADVNGGLSAELADLDDDRPISRLVFDDELDPQRLVILEVRGLGGLAQRVQARLFDTLGRSGEAGKLEDHERAPVHFAQGQRQAVAPGFDPDFG